MHNKEPESLRQAFGTTKGAPPKKSNSKKRNTSKNTQGVQSKVAEVDRLTAAQVGHGAAVSNAVSQEYNDLPAKSPALSTNR